MSPNYRRGLDENTEYGFYLRIAFHQLLWMINTFNSSNTNYTFSSLIFCSHGIPKTNTIFHHVPLPQPICGLWPVVSHLTFSKNLPELILTCYLAIPTVPVPLFLLDDPGFFSRRFITDHFKVSIYHNANQIPKR